MPLLCPWCTCAFTWASIFNRGSTASPLSYSNCAFVCYKTSDRTISSHIRPVLF